MLIEVIDELFHICGNLSLQRRSEHLAGAVADDLIEQRPRRTSVVVGRSGVVNYREHGRTFLNQRANAGS